jgi:hypothetical protein
MLSVEKRNNEDLRTLGNLFYYCCDELKDIQFSEALALLLEILRESLRQFIYLTEKRVQEFIDYFISRLPAFFKERLKLSVCES